MNKRELYAHARKRGRREFSRYQPEELKSIRAGLTGVPPGNEYVLGAWASYRPSAASAEEYPGIEALDYNDLYELDLHWLVGANQILNGVGLIAVVPGKWLDGRLVLRKEKGNI